jgi:hypothetical protein
LHIKKSEIGTQLIRLGVAVAMFLSDCSVCQIMMIGRWSSDAFLQYIHKQVKQFSHNISTRMVTQMFHLHIPAYTTPVVSHLDPRQRNNPNNAETRRNVGGDITGQARLPPFALPTTKPTTQHGFVRHNNHNPLFSVIFLSGTKIYLDTKVEEASLLVPTELGKGVESLLEQDSKPNSQVVLFTSICVNPSYWQ